ncbi:MAG: hypothetical protein H6Q05_2744 [Acidobacteria bacterium]|nr:hypothetical protein [Acidobacteriota bacterium]
MLADSGSLPPEISCRPPSGYGEGACQSPIWCGTVQVRTRMAESFRVSPPEAAAYPLNLLLDLGLLHAKVDLLFAGGVQDEDQALPSDLLLHGF